ncbi:MAG TPA: L-threonylcarbamoyladenylate synthase [Candidatus Woesebacteria bacterium]|nr:L-threonylcarbamoyladenylate synthase [Candidatus Woesebacteria bacterium]
MLDKKKVIKQTIEVLKNGGLVVFPTDTVYGLLVDATNEKAVEKLIAFKNRPPGKAISVFVNNGIMSDYVEVSEKTKSLLAHMLPGPFTVILPSKHKTSLLLESEKGTLGIRIPANELITELVAAYGKPITATSANLGGQSPHYSVESLLHQVSKEKHKLIDLIIDGGQLPRNKPSTVVDLSQQEIKVIRQGDILLGDVRKYISKKAEETKGLGIRIAESVLKKEEGKPIVFILVGDLGSGKTIFTKGIAEYLQAEKVISPTFVVYYEYDISVKNYKKLIHADLYNIEEEEEFEHLGLENYLKEGTIMVIEWGEKLGDLYEKFKEKAKLVYVSINYVSEEEREVKVNL